MAKEHIILDIQDLENLVNKIKKHSNIAFPMSILIRRGCDFPSSGMFKKYYALISLIHNHFKENGIFITKKDLILWIKERMGYVDEVFFQDTTLQTYTKSIKHSTSEELQDIILYLEHFCAEYDIFDKKLDF